jgi:Beta-galactosidase/beta-glucuronidase
MKTLILTISLFVISTSLFAQKTVSEQTMQQIYSEVRTPHKYGLVVAPEDNNHKTDCPTVFRKDGKWYMSYLVYDGKGGRDGRGYETWLAESDDLLEWKTLGRILSYPPEDSERWDKNQLAGYISLIDNTWGGSYEPKKYKGKYWLSYFGGTGRGYESGMLHEGIAFTTGDITKAHEWQTLDKPILSPTDKNAGWWENITQYKSSVFWDKSKKLGKPFVLFYNAGGINPENNVKAERIGIALSSNMQTWTRYKGNPVVNHEEGITGDAYIQKLGDLYVMFYFGAFRKDRPYKAFNTFAASYDLVNWTDWTGEDLIVPTEKYDNLFAHKSCVVKWNDVVYHFYCAVNEDDQRGIALATSKNLGKSLVRFPKPDKETFRKEIPLNCNWETAFSEQEADFCDCSYPDYPGVKWEKVDIPHNWDKYEGVRRLRHGNLHGHAAYRKNLKIENEGEGKRYFLYFEGVGSYATVYLNGDSVGAHAGGRTTFTIDITENIDFDTENTLIVVANHQSVITDLPWVCGGCSFEWGFSEGSQPLGIFRPVTLVVSDEARIEPFGVHAYNHEPDIQGNDTIFELNFSTEIRNYGTRDREIEVVQKLTDKDGRQVERVTERISLKAGEFKIVTQKSGKINNPKLWNTETPYLYKLTTMIRENGRVIDEEITPYGFRWMSFSHTKNNGDNRFYLNGKPVFVNGICEYEHILGASHAFSEEQVLSRVSQMKAAGFNAFRDAHQPHHLLYGQMWEKTGTLWWTQFSAHIWYDTEEFRNNFKTLLREWVRERRNSPAIMIWGLQNESVLPEDFARECTEIIRELDPTSPTQRLVTTCNGGVGTDWNVVQNWSGTYGGVLENYAAELSRPDQLLNGEYGAWRSIGFHTEDVTTRNSEATMCHILGTKIRLAEQARDSVVGQFMWLYNSHDNPGRTQNDESAREMDKTGPFNYKGLVTPWEEPVDAYYMYKSNYTDKHKSPMVYVVSHTWTDRWQEPGIKNNIVVYSNCDEVELFNDISNNKTSLGKIKNQGKGVNFTWNNVDIQYNILYAVGYVDGKAVAEDYIIMENLPKSPNFETLFTQKPFVTNSTENSNYIYRVNCGGEQDYTDSEGNTWQADCRKEAGNFWGSTSWAEQWDYLPPFLLSQSETKDFITGTQDWELFQTFRYGRDKLKYIFPLPDGEYTAELYFIEPWWGRDRSMDCEGYRIFDVAINNDTVLKNLDIWKEAGVNNVLKKSVKANAKNGTLEISFPRILAGQAVISAIAITSETAGISPAPASPEKFTTKLDETKTYWQAEEEHRPLVIHEAEDAQTTGKGWKKFIQRNQNGTGVTLAGKHSITWEIKPGIAEVYPLSFYYANNGTETIMANIQIISAENIILREAMITFPPTGEKPRVINTSTGTTINAGNYRVIISGDNLNGLWFDALRMQ